MANQHQMANAIRALAMDAVQQANSGHPGAPMGMADMAVALWGEHLQHNPSNPNWANRDRFVLSKGHAAPVLYSALAEAGYFGREHLATLRAALAVAGLTAVGEPVWARYDPPFMPWFLRRNEVVQDVVRP